MAGFAANNNKSASTKLSLFFATKSLHPHISFHKIEVSDTSTFKRIFNQKALDISGNMQTTWEFVQKALVRAQKSQSKQVNKHRKDKLYAVSDKVWLSIKNIITDWPSKKLDHMIFGFFEVIGNKKVSVELQLPQSIKIHYVFYPNLLQKALTNLLTNQVNEPPPLVIINNKKKWEVKDILDARSHQGKLQYRVKYVGLGEDREWYDAVRFENFPEIVKDFYSRYPEKPKSEKPAV